MGRCVFYGIRFKIDRMMCMKCVIKVGVGLVLGVGLVFVVGEKMVLGVECKPSLNYVFEGSDYVKLKLTKGNRLNIEVGSKHLAKLGYGRVRLFYPKGVVYKVGDFKFKQNVNGVYMWQSQVEVGKAKFDYLVVEVDVVPGRLRRRGRVGRLDKRIYLQTMIDKNGDVPVEMEWESYCWVRGVRGRVFIKDDEVDKVKRVGAELISRFKKRIGMKKVGWKKNTEGIVIEFDEWDASSVNEDWYSLQIDIFKEKYGKVVKKIIAFPVRLIDQRSKFKITNPLDNSQLELITPIKLEGLSVVGGKFLGWYRKDVGKWVQFMEEVDVDRGSFTKEFNWQTKDLEAGSYDLKVRMMTNGGEVVEREVQGLYKMKPNGGFGIQVINKVQLPELIVATLDQVIEGWVGEAGGNEAVKIYDQRGVGAGWVLTAKFSDLYSPEADSFIKAKDLLWVRPGPVRVYQGNGNGITEGEPVMISGDDQWVVLSRAEAGFGEGVYGQSVFVKWLIPANTPAGDYKGVIVFTLQ